MRISNLNDPASWTCGSPSLHPEGGAWKIYNQQVNSVDYLK